MLVGSLGADKLGCQTELFAALRTGEVFDVKSRTPTVLRMHVPLLGWPHYIASTLQTFHHTRFTSVSLCNPALDEDHMEEAPFNARAIAAPYYNHGILVFH
ncbi:MAG TPA: hypothetical protein VEH56_06225 [Candidatus Saccharimonadales bacterium]|nr:hypothetical protein [Candidatus Saccharimonadales bacterium]